MCAHACVVVNVCMCVCVCVCVRYRSSLFSCSVNLKLLSGMQCIYVKEYIHKIRNVIN